MTAQFTWETPDVKIDDIDEIKYRTDGFETPLDVLIYLDRVFRAYVLNKVDWIDVRNTLKLSAELIERFRSSEKEVDEPDKTI